MAIDARGHMSATMPQGITLQANAARLHALVVMAHGWHSPARLPCRWQPLDQRPPIHGKNGVRYVVLEQGERPRLKLVMP